MVFDTLAADAETEWLMIDSTLVRAHQHSAGGKGTFGRLSANPAVGFQSTPRKAGLFVGVSRAACRGVADPAVARRCQL